MHIEPIIREPYHPASWLSLLSDLFPGADLFYNPQPLDITAPQVSSVHQLGTVALGESTLALLVIETGDHVLLSRNKVALRNFISKLITPGLTDAVLAVFHQPGSDDWRLTYAAKRTILDEETYTLSEEQTAPKRFSFLLGPSEPCKTAAARLKQIQLKSQDLSLKDIEDAFSVEKLSKEFFTKYQLHYQAFLSELLSPERAADTRTRFSIPTGETEEAQSKADKPVRDFAKKLLGRLIFLAFLQKKGWLHPTAREIDWSSGDRNFLNTYFTLAEAYKDAANFHSHYLAPLFFEALNTERKDHLFTLPLPGGKTFTSRMPYLNGGLFEPDPAALQSIDFPPQLFANLFSFFSEYNFTIDENDPEDHEVGIDPEMLGHIFENLLEDNKDKGAYYTPKVIVSYMCRQSLLRYLETHLGQNEALTRLCEIHEPGDLREKGNWCARNAKSIATLLENVKICDPAIGSGAFPIGMLNEIVHLRTLLNSELNDPAERAALKKNIIAHCIHGVDLDSGAVDIARLRFWLALVVDEETPSPLPNLDYKIMQGNSLLESFHGVPLSEIHQEKGKSLRAPLGLNQGELEMFTSTQLELREAGDKKRDELREAMRAYFAARKPERKTVLRDLIDSKVLEHIRHYFDVTIGEIEIEHHQQVDDWKEKERRAPGWKPPAAAQKRHEKRGWHMATLRDALAHLDEIQHLPERPYFLWHLLFRDVFENGGFDIVIANPPYVRQELIKDQKPLLAAEGYTTATGTADLLVYFYERAATLLKPSGVLTFITSNKFYRAGYGEKLRQYLAENLTLHTLIDFGEAPVFNGVAVDATVLIGQKETAPSDHKVAALPWDLAKPAALLPMEISKAFPVAQTSLTPVGWILVSPAVQNLLTKLRANGNPLGEYVNGRFYYGIKTGFNDAFVINGSKRAELIAADPQSEKIIKPFLRGRDIERWQANHADLWLLFIPWHFPLHEDETISGASTEAEKAFKAKYPAIFAHLLSFKERLSARNAAETGIRYEWYALQRCAASYWREFDHPKILLQIIKRDHGFAFTEKGYYSNDKSSICITDRSTLAVLNSKVIEWICKRDFPSLGDTDHGGRVEYRPNLVIQLPIPPATDSEKATLATLAESCAAATAAGDAETLAAREAEINAIVYQLFHLTPTEIALIEGTASA